MTACYRIPYRVPRRYRRRSRSLHPAVAGAALAAAAIVALPAAATAVGRQGHHHAPAPVLAGSTKQIGRQMAARVGWTGGQWGCLDALWTRESGWRTNADTRVTHLDPPWATVYAFGIPQARPASKMATAGPDWATNPATQIRWGLGYIRNRYTTPCGAWAHETAKGWY